MSVVSELAQLDPNAPVNAYRIGFDYAIILTETVFVPLSRQYYLTEKG
jgi:hypothetical protein